MRVAKQIFLIAGIIGLIEVAPLYFTENQIGHSSPPPITHPEYYQCSVKQELRDGVCEQLAHRANCSHTPSLSSCLTKH